MTTTILLARHGETDWNRDHRVQGHADVPLNDTGREQALALAAALEGRTIEAVYASDLVRAAETAQPAAERRGLAVTLVPGLREKHFGSWEGLTDDEILERFPDAVRGHWGDGETTDDVRARVLAALDAIVGSHPGGTVLIVAHGGPLRAILTACDAAHEGAIANGHVFTFVSREGTLVYVDADLADDASTAA